MGSTDTGNQAIQRPFIIWTLQRTGGTNLTRHLMQRAKYPRPQHEPFNRKREFGHVTREWVQHEDTQRLEASMTEICSEEPCIKHCVEQVPWPVSVELARAAMLADYHHLFLYRRNALQRLLSVEYARRTGVWGRGHLNKAEQDDKAFEEPLAIRDMLAHEKRCNNLLQSMWNILTEAGADPKCVAYEDVYETDDDTAAETLLTILRNLGLSRGETSDHEFIRKIRTQGYQGTRDRYRRFRGIAELARGLEKVEPFDPHARSGGRAGLMRHLAGFGRWALGFRR